MLKVGNIGFGNAGGQVTDLAKKEYNIPGIVLNSSEKDISTILHVNKLIVGDEKGAGKDRAIAKQFMKEHIQGLLKQEDLKSLIEENEVIFVNGATGGGTASGMIPVSVDILRRVYPTKRFIVGCVFPTLKEAAATQQNTIDFLKELKRSNPTYMCYDNQRYAHLPVSEMLQTVNREIALDMAIIRGDFQYATPFNSIDEKDALKIVETPGRLFIAKAWNIKEKDLDQYSLEDLLINNIKTTSANAELDRDRIVKRSGLIVNLNEQMQKLLNIGLPIVQELVGAPVEDFQHIYVNKEADEANNIMLMLSGLSDPDDRIQKMLQRIEEVQAQLSKVKESSILDDADMGLIGGLRDTSNPVSKQPEEINVNDIFNDYM